MYRAVCTCCCKRTGLCGGGFLYPEDIVLWFRDERIDIAALRHEIHAHERIATARRRDKDMCCSIFLQEIQHACRITHRRRQLGWCRDHAIFWRQRGNELFHGLVPDAVCLCQRPAEETSHDAASLRRKCTPDVCKIRTCEDVEAREIDHDRACARKVCGI